MMRRKIKIIAKDSNKCKRFKKIRLIKVVCRYCCNTYYITNEEWFGVLGAGKSFSTSKYKIEDTKICWNCLVKLLLKSRLFKMSDYIIEEYLKRSLRSNSRGKKI